MIMLAHSMKCHSPASGTEVRWQSVFRPHNTRPNFQMGPYFPQISASNVFLPGSRWPQPIAENHPRYKVQRWKRGCQIGLPPEKWSSLMYGLWPDGGLKNGKEATHCGRDRHEAAAD